MREVDHRVQDRRRRHQRHRDRGCAVTQRRQQEHHQHQEGDHDADQRQQPAPARHRDDHHRERDRERDQRPAAFEVVKRVAGGALCVDLPDEPDVIARRELGLAGPGGELQQGVGAGVRSGIDRNERLVRTARRPGSPAAARW